MKTKYHYYKTALWSKNGEYVALEKYHSYGNYYDIRTIAGERFRAFVCELCEFCL